MASNYGRKPDFTPSRDGAPCVKCQSGWSPFSVADGSQVLQAKALNGQLVVTKGQGGSEPATARDVLWAAVLQVEREGIQYVTHVEQVANTRPISLKVSYSGRQRNRQGDQTVTIGLASLLIAAAAGREVVDAGV